MSLVKSLGDAACLAGSRDVELVHVAERLWHCNKAVCAAVSCFSGPKDVTILMCFSQPVPAT